MDKSELWKRQNSSIFTLLIKCTDGSLRIDAITACERSELIGEMLLMYPDCRTFDISRADRDFNLHTAEIVFGNWYGGDFSGVGRDNLHRVFELADYLDDKETIWDLALFVRQQRQDLQPIAREIAEKINVPEAFACSSYE